MILPQSVTARKWQMAIADERGSRGGGRGREGVSTDLNSTKVKIGFKIQMCTTAAALKSACRAGWARCVRETADALRKFWPCLRESGQ